MTKPATPRTMKAFNQFSSPEKRFWAKVRRTNSCWLWIGTSIKSGTLGDRRPKFNVNGVPTLAYRFSWELHCGPIPQNLCVCHHCDNPLCVRPDHLFVGTIADNNRDMHAKGRAWVTNHPKENAERARKLNARIKPIRGPGGRWVARSALRELEAK